MAIDISAPPEIVGEVSNLLKVLAEPNRLAILLDGERCVCEIGDALGLAQPLVSHHLKQLASAGAATVEKRGRWHYYRAAPGLIDELATNLRDLRFVGAKIIESSTKGSVCE